jgi:ribosome-associated toxin RatA of RatAB toxin-antitoxin module
MWKPFFSVVTKRHVERKILQTTPRHLFHIIQDVDSYSQFLPLCTESKILRRSSGRQFEAALTVGLPPLFTETYVSRVRFDPENLTVHAKSIESSLFEALDSKWILKEVDSEENLCDVHFEVEMSVSNPVIVNALDQVLREVAGKQVAAFERRCHEIPMLPQDNGRLKH